MSKPPEELFFISASDLALLCRVDLSTARRWKRGAICPPHAVIVLATGDLGGLSEYWRGWRIRGDTIISPDGWTISRNDALAVPLLHGQIAALRHDLAKAKEAAECQIEEQPTPEQWEYSVG